MGNMTTLSEVLNDLREQGYTEDLNPGGNCIVCGGSMLQIHPDDFVVDRHYRFEGMTDPDDQAVVYAISSEKYNIKGVLVNGYGVYSDDASNEIIKKLEQKIR